MKKEPDFMQRCYDCRKIIWTYEPANPDVCKKCFKYPKPTVQVFTFNFEVKPPVPYVWQESPE